MICGGVLVPLNDGTNRWRRICFVEEALGTDKYTAKRLRLELDHFIPRWLAPRIRLVGDGPLHYVHAYCQRQQGGRIGGMIVAPFVGKIAVESGQLARMNASLTPEQRSRIGRIGSMITVESGQLARMRASLTPEQLSRAGKAGAPVTNHNRWHRDRGVTNPVCTRCTRERKEQA